MPSIPQAVATGGTAEAEMSREEAGGTSSRVCVCASTARPLDLLQTTSVCTGRRDTHYRQIFI